MTSNESTPTPAVAVSMEADSTTNATRMPTMEKTTTQSGSFPQSDPERLLEYFITVGIGDVFTSQNSVYDLENSRPITAISVCIGKQAPPNCDLMKCTITGASASLRNGLFGSHSWLAYSRDPSLGEPLTEIVVLKEDECPKGFVKVDHNFQTVFKRSDIFGRQTNPSYIFVERHPVKVPIAEVILVAEADGEVAPPDFWKVQNDSQFGIKFGNGLDLYYKKCPATPLDQVYKPNVIDRYPRKDAPLSPLPVVVAQFCQPNGSVLMRSAPLPTSHDFVLTNSFGRKMYGSALTCFEPLSLDVWNRSLDTILEKFPRMSVSSEVITEHFNFHTLPPKSVTADCQSPEHNTRCLSLSFESKPLYASKTICLLSYYPFFESFNVMLAELYRISVSPQTFPLERILSNLFEIPVPLSPRLASQIQIGSKSISFNVPNSDEDLPLINCSFDMVFRCLPLDLILVALNALMLERKVILVSIHPRLLTPTAHTLLSLMFPLEWQYSYIPVLPRVISVIIDAPMPVFVGLRQAYVDPRLYERPDIVVINLDTRTSFVHPSSPLLPLPATLTAVLRQELEQFGHLSSLHPISKDELDSLDLTFNIIPSEAHASSQLHDEEVFNQRAVRAAFVHFFTGLFGRFRDFLLFPEVPENVRLDELFEKKAFLDEKPKGPIRQFVQALIETQCFTRFIEERTFPSDRDSELKFFDRCCDYHHSVEAIADKAESLAGLVQSLLEAPEIKAVYRVPPPLSLSVNGPALSPSPAYACFPVLDPKLLYDPRPVVVENMRDWGPAKAQMLRTEFQEAFFLSRPVAVSLFQHRGSIDKLTKTFESNIDWARHLLMLVYSSWFLLASISVDWNTSLTEAVVDDAFQILNRIRKSGLIADESTYRSMLKLCAKFSRAESARTILQLMKDSGIQPSQVTYALFTSAVTEAPISPKTRQSLDFTRHFGNKTLTISPDMKVNWKITAMSTVSICPGCNSRLSDCEIMAGWNDDPNHESTRCIVCRTSTFVPELNIRLTLMNGKTDLLQVPYISPLVLRNLLEVTMSNQHKDVFGPERFRIMYPKLYYNLLWYFYYEQLPLINIVGDNEVKIKPLMPEIPMESLLTQQERDSAITDRFGDRGRKVMGALTRYLRRGDVLNAMRLFLLHRTREANIGGSGVLDKTSVWSHSMFREMEALGAQWFFPSRIEWLRAYSEALGSVPRHMVSYMLPMDNAPSGVTSIFEDVFKHKGSGSIHPNDSSPQRISSDEVLKELPTEMIKTVAIETDIV
uniref:UDENN domain-containing protein n=1 Tax=Spongospora subterranea TaxID=70186 RepID=A0A0H5R942_9EUKA|eukprot:CRZ10227.1 hypothetical protein [Spongospora subterranea]